LTQFLDEEAVRVADAVAFAEILVPRLAERLSGAHAPRPHAPSIPPAQRGIHSANDAGARGIADFIDEMLAQDQPRTSA
jgi:hypothetical protein